MFIDCGFVYHERLHGAILSNPNSPLNAMNGYQLVLAKSYVWLAAPIKIGSTVEGAQRSPIADYLKVGSVTDMFVFEVSL